MEYNEKLIKPGTRTDWFVHEINNALLPVVCLMQEQFDIDPEMGKTTLQSFLKNVKDKDLVWSEQGPLSDGEMIEFAEKLLRVPWIPRQFENIIKMKNELFERIDKSYR